MHCKEWIWLDKQAKNYIVIHDDGNDAGHNAWILSKIGFLIFIYSCGDKLILAKRNWKENLKIILEK